ncbi:MAG: hypothetical protein A2146_08860 [Actinobacteria bacterium RBG_16_67_10]|nr:MAG: hypothetical protein A2146_08860 [Actinobacteria bacterium RBG_16_67_10]
METFVVRIWRPAQVEGADGDQAERHRQPLRGLVRRVSEGTELPFAGADELIDLLATSPVPSAEDVRREPRR